ncbi:hypothetical protein ML462_01170 [Gramella lutea]|uniref:Uncharacterized protein n=1 Tax=Christiangramia lutea TaxID=1607951 RepID=A0A9X2A7T3_9FLAO|nr:hypothetical protein [Christiangramia lutea]MCH4821769.1 hypothetical protein [Christiangramia lutea]
MKNLNFLHYCYLFLSAFILFSCEEESITDKEPQDLNKTEEKIMDFGVSENELLKSSTFLNSFKTYKKSQNLNNDIPINNLINRLDLNNAYYHKDKRIEVLNVPFKTFGNYKRVLFSYTKSNKNTNSFILTYPDPMNDSEFYVSNIEGELLQRVNFDQNGHSTIESYIFNTLEKNGEGCTETVYWVCTSGEHSYEYENAGDCTFWHDSSGTPPRVSTFPIDCFGTGGLGTGGSEGGGGTDGGTGGVTSGPTGGDGSTPPSLTPEECLENLDCEDCGLPMDLNKDCNVSYDEAHFATFLESLNRNEKYSLRNNTRLYESTLSYLISKNHTTDSRNFSYSALLAVMDGGDVDFENEIIKDQSFIGIKADCVLEELINTGNNLFKRTSEAFTDNRSKYRIKFTTYNESSDSADARTAMPDSNNVIEIRININRTGLANNSNAIDLAALILHEVNHAELHRIHLSNNSGPNPLPTAKFEWFEKLWRLYDNPLNSEPPQTTSEHYYMSRHMIDPIAYSVREYDKNLHNIENYLFFAWQGLEEYGKSSGQITQQELNDLAWLSNAVTHDSYNSPCD